MAEKKPITDYECCRLFGSDDRYNADIESCIEEYLDINGLDSDDEKVKDIEIEIEFGEEDTDFDWNHGVLEDLLERIDCELLPGDWTEPTEAMKEAEKRFVEAVKKEYPVRPMRARGVRTIRIGDYL